MNESNTRGRRQKNRKKAKPSYRVIILFLGILIFASGFCLFSGRSYFSRLIAPDAQTEIVINGKIEQVSPDSSEMQFTDEDPDWNLRLVNSSHPVPEKHTLKLISLPGGEKVDVRIYEPLMKMLEAAKEENWNQLPEVLSGYRTRETQEKLYSEKIAEYRQKGYSEEDAIEQAGQWVAAPGHSEHQMGFAVDLNGATYDFYFWLQENSYKYGFIFRYPGNKTDITGAAEEVWHYRYVGVEAATEMYEQGLCLEEYLDIA